MVLGGLLSMSTLDVGSGFRTGLVESRWVVVVSGKLTLAVSVALVGGSL